MLLPSCCSCLCMMCCCLDLKQVISSWFLMLTTFTLNCASIKQLRQTTKQLFYQDSNGRIPVRGARIELVFVVVLRMLYSSPDPLYSHTNRLAWCAFSTYELECVASTVSFSFIYFVFKVSVAFSHVLSTSSSFPGRCCVVVLTLATLISSLILCLNSRSAWG